MIAALLSFWLITLSGALSPGPLTATALTLGAKRGFWSGPKMAIGHALVEAPLAFGLTYGLGLWLKQPPIVAAIGIAGSLFLLWMAYGMLKDALSERTSLQELERQAIEEGVKSSTGEAVLAGALLSVSNPYWVLWWATLGATYILKITPFGLVGLVILYLGHWSVDLIWLSLMAFATSSGKGLLGDRGYRLLLGLNGLFLLFFGIYFAWNGWSTLIKL